MSVFNFGIVNSTGMEENWDDAPVQGFTEQPITAAPDLPEIKLFGRWSCDDVQISDMSLEVRTVCRTEFVLVELLYVE